MSQSQLTSSHRDFGSSLRRRRWVAKPMRRLSDSSRYTNPLFAIIGSLDYAIRCALVSIRFPAWLLQVVCVIPLRAGATQPSCLHWET